MFFKILWEEIEELLMEASADGLTKLHKLVHSVMKQRNLISNWIENKKLLQKFINNLGSNQMVAL